MRLSNLSKEGYLLIDHRNSPGVSEELIRSFGKFVPAVNSGALFEGGTITCSHCNGVVVVNPDRTRPRGYCRSCDHYVCDSPGCNSECSPFKRKIDILQENAFRIDNGYV